MKKILFTLLCLLPITSFAAVEPTNKAPLEKGNEIVSQESDSGDLIKTMGTIKKIEIKGSRRNKKHIATVEYTVSGSTEKITSYLKLVSIPFYGSFNKEGDSIEILYSKSNPTLISTSLGNFVEKYGMYILIILGIFFSLYYTLSAMRKKK